MHARMQHHCTHARRQYTIPSTNSGEPREPSEVREGRRGRAVRGVHRGRSVHRLAGQLKIFLGGRAGVPCALCALPARLGVSAHLGAPSLSGKRITAMYEGAMSRCTSRFVRHHYTRHHHIRNRHVRTSPGHTSPLITLEYPSRVSTNHALHVAHHATLPRLAASRLPDASAIYSWRGKHSHRTASHHSRHSHSTATSICFSHLGDPPRLVRGDMHRDMHALPDREGAPPSRFRVRVLRPRLCRVLCQQRGQPRRPGRVPETGESSTASTVFPQRPDASSVSGQRSVCALCCAAYCVRTILRCVLCPPFPPPAPYINTPWLSLLC